MQIVNPAKPILGFLRFSFEFAIVILSMLKQQETLNLLLSGKHPRAKKYAGHHVLVVKDKIVPLKDGKEAIEDIKILEKKYGKTPTLVFVPRQDISYILFLCPK